MTAAGRRLLAGYGHVQSTDGPPNEEPPWCAADDEPWPCPFSQNILAIEAEARASLDVRNLMRDALSMLEDSEPLHASDDHRMWRIMDSLREYAADNRRGTISEHKEGK